ncbi:hypothetical protein GLOIN_2v1483995 [Rhizophagus clarus]|uniref:Uncharacterized protein n=1 Tax=Rhizophagus clarus TaxID=94130 RepID=A0A8H3QYT4_9GLOM|nr:hypothetical protein GLOIN_2v1483995 [Rhizophagus clarus]
MRQNQRKKGFKKTIIKPAGYGPSYYDPRIDYDYLVWESYYESHKGEEDVEEMKKIFDLYDKNDWEKINMCKK